MYIEQRDLFMLLKSRDIGDKPKVSMSLISIFVLASKGLNSSWFAAYYDFWMSSDDSITSQIFKEGTGYGYIVGVGFAFAFIMAGVSLLLSKFLNEFKILEC